MGYVQAKGRNWIIEVGAAFEFLDRDLGARVGVDLLGEVDELKSVFARNGGVFVSIAAVYINVLLKLGDF